MTLVKGPHRILKGEPTLREHDDNLTAIDGIYHRTGGRWMRNVKKHSPGGQTHDQSQHGNWADGLTPGILPADPVPDPEGPQDGDIVLYDTPENVQSGVDEWFARTGRQPPAIDYPTHKIDHAFQMSIADAYEAMPTYMPSAEPAYAAFATEIDEQFEYITETMGIQPEWVDFDAYTNAAEAAQDIAENSKLSVLTTITTGSHPLLTDEQNDKFRFVHDIFGHVATGRSFDRHGEEVAFMHHSSMFSDEAQQAMASETRGQNAGLIATGDFPEQKVGILPDWSRVTVPVITKHAPGGVQHDQSEHGNWASGVDTANLESATTPEGLSDPRFLAQQELESAEFRPGIDDNPDLIAMADTRFSQGLTKEADLTPALMAVADQTGGQLVGLDFRVKTPYKLRDKILRTMDEFKYGSLEEAAAAVGDVNRYTMTWDPDSSWNANMDMTFDALRERGWNVSSFSSSFGSGGLYEGINVKLNNGADILELQMHTAESFSIKEANHPAYSEYRNESTDPARRAVLGQQMVASWSGGTHLPVEYASLVAPVLKRRLLKADLPFPRHFRGPNESFFRTNDRNEVERWEEGGWVDSTLTLPELEGFGGDVFNEIDDKEAMGLMTDDGGVIKRRARARVAKFSTRVQVAKADEYENLVFGWANVTVTPDGRQVIDHQGHAIDTEDLESAAYDFVIKDLGSGDMHTPNEGFGELVESMVFTKEKMELLGIEGMQEGWWVGFKVPPEEHRKVRDGKRTQFSIEGSAKLQPLDL